MEIIKPPKQTFMAELERFEPASRDSTAIVAAKTCMRYYFYTMVCGFVDKESPMFFKFGSAYHKFREVLETYQGDQEKKYEAAIVSALLEFGMSDPPIGGKFYFLTRERLLKTCKKAYVHRNKELTSGNVKVLKSEQAFEVLLLDGKTRRGGKLDQILQYGGRTAIRDFKTTSKNIAYYERLTDPNDQFTGYLLGISKLTGEYVGLLVVEVVHNSKSEGPTIKTFLATRTSWQLEQWEREQVVIEEMISVCRGRDIWPMEEKACPFCKFRSVCKMGTEQAQQARLQQEFTQRAWDYKSLGEDAD